MQIKLLHAISSGVIIALVLGLYLIPATWQMMNREPTFGQRFIGMELIGIVASVAIIVVTLLSFKLVRKTEKRTRAYVKEGRLLFFIPFISICQAN